MGAAMLGLGWWSLLLLHRVVFRFQACLFSQSIIHKTGKLTHTIVEDSFLFNVMGHEICELTVAFLKSTQKNVEEIPFTLWKHAFWDMT